MKKKTELENDLVSILSYLGNTLAEIYPNHQFGLTASELQLYQNDERGNSVEVWWIEIDESDEAWLVSTRTRIPLGDPKCFDKIIKQHDAAATHNADAKIKVKMFDKEEILTWNRKEEILVFSKQHNKFLSIDEFIR